MNSTSDVHGYAIFQVAMKVFPGSWMIMASIIIIIIILLELVRGDKKVEIRIRILLGSRLC